MCEERKPLLGCDEESKIVKYGGVNEEKNENLNEVKEDVDIIKDEEENTVRKKKSQCSPWLVVFASFLCICVLDGTMYSFGSLLEPLMIDLVQPRSTVSIAGSLQVAASAFVGPLAASLVTKFGPRYVCMVGSVMATFGLTIASFASSLVGIFLGQSILTGLGFGLMYIPAVVAVAERFRGLDRGGLAMSLAVAGAGAGQVAMAPLVSLLVEEYGWRGSLRGLAAISISCAAIGLLMRSRPAASDEEEGMGDDYEEDEVVVNRRPILTLFLGQKIASTEYLWVFLLVVVADAMAVMALYIPYSFLGGVAEAKDVSPDLTALLISCIGLGSVVGRLLAGWLCDQPWVHPLSLTRAALALAAPIPFLLAWVDHFWMFAGLALLFGFLTGQWISTTSPLLVKLLGISQLSQAFGLLTAVRGAASLASPPLAGLLVDLTGRGNLSLQISGSFLLVATAIYSVAVFVLNKKRRVLVMYEKI